MKIQVLSDLHLEFEEYKYEETDADVVVLAGDIDKGSRGVDFALTIPKPVVYVFGNHEYYGGSYPSTLEKAKEKAQGTNVHLLENESVILDGVKFLGCTLWTDFNLFKNSYVSKIIAGSGTNDYRLIQSDNSLKRLSTHETQDINSDSVEFLKKEMEEGCVVVSHHAPSLKSASSIYKSDPLTASFASDLEDLILEGNPSVWIHGHMHNTSEYEIGNTKIVANPKGYRDENKDFYSKFKVDISRKIE